ncbi:MAG: response regulator transcription factor [Bacteroidetes bacterium]|jgi:DNA-binding NarL/FixJ family response regulator|nr:response regulator transcription factor [Bacteroidota bacterium]
MKSNDHIRLMLVDDHQMMLDGLKSLLGEQDDFEVVAAVSSAAEVLKMLQRVNVDVLIADIHLPGMDGIELAKTINVMNFPIKILALTMHNESSLINKMIEAGAWGYVVKSNNISELVEAIRTVAAGNKYLSREVQSIVMNSIFKPGDAIQSVQPKVLHLTKRESEILNLIAKEFSNREIADKLFISERTVESHRKNILIKTKTKSVVGLIKFAIEHELIK